MSFQCHSDLSSYDFIKCNKTLHSFPESWWKYTDRSGALVKKSEKCYKRACFSPPKKL